MRCAFIVYAKRHSYTWCAIQKWKKQKQKNGNIIFAPEYLPCEFNLFESRYKDVINEKKGKIFDGNCWAVFCSTFRFFQMAFVLLFVFRMKNTQKSSSNPYSFLAMCELRLRQLPLLTIYLTRSSLSFRFYFHFGFFSAIFRWCCILCFSHL